MLLTNKIALVTGANRGIGRALVDVLLERGASRVYAGARDIHRLDGLWDKRVTPLTLDITDDRQIAAAVEQVGRLDVLINNAGVAILDDIVSGDLAVVQQHFDVNLFGPLKVTRAFLPRLENSRGAVINILSTASIASVPVVAGYSSSKAASFSLTQSLRAILAPKGVAVHAVLPGPVDTDMSKGIEVPKAPAIDVARATLDAFEKGSEDIFPDPLSYRLHDVWEASPTKSLEREFSAFAGNTD
jgi:NAD(P)-dependent dehydrogenase (short-subunit alcohol dehydrogenase family)